MMEQQALDVHGTGVCASRLLSGSLLLHHELEEEVAEFKSKPCALVLNSGPDSIVTGTTMSGIWPASCKGRRINTPNVWS